MYYVWLKQKGRGCKYTIDCGRKLIPLKGTSNAAIEAEVKQALEDHGSSDIEKVLILTDNDVQQFDLAAHHRAEKEQREREVREAQEAKERAEFERLQKKFQK